jgi:hypothetical protein
MLSPNSQPIRKLIAAVTMSLGVIIVIGYSPVTIYSLPFLYIEFGWVLICTGLVMYKFWNTCEFTLFTIPLIIYCIISLNYAVDHNGAGLTNMVLSIALVKVAVVESKYSNCK